MKEPGDLGQCSSIALAPNSSPEFRALAGAENAAEAMELAWTNKHVKYFRVRGAPMWIGGIGVWAWG